MSHSPYRDISDGRTTNADEKTVYDRPMSSEEKKDIACRRCGVCCHVDMVAYVTPEDMQRWEKEGRYDIIDRLSGNEVIWAGDRIIDRYGAKVTECAYLKWDGERFFCEIYETRPMVCRSYVPGSSELCPLYHRKG